MKKSFASITLLVLLLAGCSSQPALTVDSQPSWILNPNQGGKTGAIGVASRTYDQKISTQRKLAITRALNELTLQRGVKVSLTITKKEKVSNDRASLHINEKSNYSASSTVMAHIQSVWQDKMSNDIYIWMVLD